MQEKEQSVSKDYLRHYDELQRLGLWDYLTGLEKNVRDLERFFSDALNLFNIQTAGGLIEFVISRFLEKFIPEHLLFVIEDAANFEPETYYFRRLNANDLIKPASWYKELKRVFPCDNQPVILSEDCRWISSSLLADLQCYETRLILPMKGIDGIFGFILFSSKVLGTSYTDSEISYLHRLVQFFSVGLQNTLNHQSSITDLKTGLFNHAYSMRRLEEELFRGRRYKTETALLLMDIDFFKRLNDTHGHLAGDAVLQEIAKTMKGKLRVEDVLSRFGGEEFTLLLPTTPMLTALEIAERLRAAVEEMKISYRGNTLAVTISIGCAVSWPANPLAPAQMLNMADEALYKSKGNGRNRVTLYEKPGV
ncbi:MAG: GGDEF domain-containing protein [Spirochaetales bacterium]|jgi:diguanylate cyclase (GGDEF)-like protein|nr:GGDEF domain-containing protein [Spirochaetales bacterium]